MPHTADDAVPTLADDDYPMKSMEDTLEAERAVTGCFLSESPVEPFRAEIWGGSVRVEQIPWAVAWTWPRFKE